MNAGHVQGVAHARGQRLVHEHAGLRATRSRSRLRQADSTVDARPPDRVDAAEKLVDRVHHLDLPRVAEVGRELLHAVLRRLDIRAAALEAGDHPSAGNVVGPRRVVQQLRAHGGVRCVEADEPDTNRAPLLFALLACSLLIATSVQRSPATEHRRADINVTRACYHRRRRSARTGAACSPTIPRSALDRCCITRLAKVVFLRLGGQLGAGIDIWWLCEGKARIMIQLPLPPRCTRLAGRSGGCAARSRAQRPPNVIIIYADDLGHRHRPSARQGAARPRTPNLDRMAAEGMRCTELLRRAGGVLGVAGRAADRASISNRIGILGALGSARTKTASTERDDHRRGAQERGYATAIFGKWHLGHHPKRSCRCSTASMRYYGLPYSNDMWPQASDDRRTFPTCR